MRCEFGNARALKTAMNKLANSSQFWQRVEGAE
jgi:hypothetical protein